MKLIFFIQTKYNFSNFPQLFLAFLFDLNYLFYAFLPPRIIPKLSKVIPSSTQKKILAVSFTCMKSAGQNPFRSILKIWRLAPSACQSAAKTYFGAF